MATEVEDPLDSLPADSKPITEPVSLPKKSVHWAFLSIAIGFICFAQTLQAQSPSNASYAFAAARVTLAQGDGQAALQLGQESPLPDSERWMFGVYGEFEGRLFGKDRLIPVSQNLRLQFQENRYTGAVGTYATLQLTSKTEARLGAGIGYTFGDFRGVSRQPSSQWVPSLEAGYSLNFGMPGVLTLGYQYRDWPNTSPHRFGITHAFFFPSLF